MSSYLQIPELIPQIGHTSQINAVAFSSHGDLLASASSDCTIKLWDIRTSKEIRTLNTTTSFFW